MNIEGDCVLFLARRIPGLLFKKGKSSCTQLFLPFTWSTGNITRHNPPPRSGEYNLTTPPPEGGGKNSAQGREFKKEGKKKIKQKKKDKDGI